MHATVDWFDFLAAMLTAFVVTVACGAVMVSRFRGWR